MYAIGYERGDAIIVGRRVVWWWDGGHEACDGAKVERGGVVRAVKWASRPA